MKGGCTTTRLSIIEGIGQSFTRKLREAGISLIEMLLKQGAAPQGRKELADKTGVSEKVLLRWVNQADLACIKGVNEEYAELLEAAGADSVPECAQRNAEHLLGKMKEINDQKN
jgi:predicted flap endonuclease-1-like 5' DNA nuclease